MGIGNEAIRTPHTLVSVPVPRGQVVREMPPPVDASSVQLRGRVFLQSLVADNRRLLPATRALIAGSKVLRNPDMNDQKLEQLAERLRPVMAQSYRDPELATFVNALATEARAFCGDRTEYYIGRMQDAARLSILTKGNPDDVTLYNAGIAFYKLDAVRDAVRVRCAEGGQHENVQSNLDAEYYLQEKLGLPTRHNRPNYYMGLGVMSEEMAEEIGCDVEESMAANDGDEVMSYMSKWGPWQEYLRKLPEHKDAFALLTSNYHEELEQAEVDRDQPESMTGKYSSQEYIDYCNSVLSSREEWDCQLVGQLTRQFLLNNRAEILLDSGVMPEVFKANF